MLKIENLVVNYGYISALRDISFEVKNNEIVCLIGSNGAGKTTSLMSISNLVKKESGKIFFQDKNITNLKPHEIVSMGISHVPEGRHVFPDLSVEENLVMGTISIKKLDKKIIEERKEEMFKLFPRLKERRTQAARTLSGGE